MDRQKLLDSIKDAINDPTEDKVTKAKEAITTLKKSCDVFSFPIFDVYQYAAESGNTDIIKCLDSCWSDLEKEATDSKENTEDIVQDKYEYDFEICQNAAKNGHFDIVEIISSNYAEAGEQFILQTIEHVMPVNFGKFFNFLDINHIFKHHNGITVLMEAAAMGNLEMVKYLFSKDVDTDVIDKYGNSVISYALSGGDQSTIAFVISHVDPNSVARELTSHGGQKRSYELSQITFEKWMI